jgi:hypothetical protein
MKPPYPGIVRGTLCFGFIWGLLVLITGVTMHDRSALITGVLVVICSIWWLRMLARAEKKRGVEQ